MNTSFNPISVNDDALTYNLEDSTQKMIETEEIDKEKGEPPSNVSSASSPSDRFKKKPIPFWSEDPNILVKPAYITEFFPTDDMSFYQKLNAITRTVFVLTMVSYLFTHNTRIISIAAMTTIAIYLLYYIRSKEAKERCDRKTKQKEGFSNDKHTELNELVRHARLYNYKGPIIDVKGNFDETFDLPTADNPLSNVLLTDYDYNPKKKPAPPAFTQAGGQNITDTTKQLVQDLNPTQPDIIKKLYSDINSNLELEQSMRQFYSTSNTTIPNDQAGFAEFCYGNMISAKDGNDFAAARDNPRYILR